MACLAQTDIGFEELLSKLIARTWMLLPYFGSRLVSTLLACGVPCLVRHMFANPVKSACTSTTPQLSERAGGDACL